MDIFTSYPREWQEAARVLGSIAAALPKRLPPQSTFPRDHPALLTRWRNLRSDILRVGRIFIVIETRRHRVMYYLPDTEEGRAIGREIRRCGDGFTGWLTR